MTDHTSETIFPGEPEGGWETGPELHDTEIISVVLCKYSGLLLQPNLTCMARDLRGHADVDCAAVYVRGKDDEGNDIDPGTVVRITIAQAGDDPTAE